MKRPSARRATLPTAKLPARKVLLSLSWYSSDIHRGIARYAEKACWHLDLSTVHDSLLPTRWNGDGILCTAGNIRTVDRRLLSYKKPIVNIGNNDHFPAPRVAADMDKVVSLAVEHFIQRGFQHLAYYVCRGNRAELAKLKIFRQAVAAAGRQFHLIDCSRYSHDARLRHLRRSLGELPKPLAVNAQVDEFATELIQASLDADLRVPEDVAVLGCDDDPLICPFAAVPLSSIDNNLEGIGYQAAALLDRYMRGERVSADVILIPPRGITVRRSTDMLAISDQNVAGAMEIIKRRYRERITAQDVADDLHISYRTLHNAFVRLVGHSMAHEMRRRRVDHAANLIIHSRLKMQKIAWESGFLNLSHMVRVFHRLKATTPGAFRRAFGRSGR